MSGRPIDLILQKLPDAKRNGKGWQARCPAHDDRHPSLSIDEDDDGQVLIFCHAGCKVDAVCSAIGIDQRELFPKRNGRIRTRAQEGRHRSAGSGYATFERAIEAAARAVNGRPAERWLYQYADAREAFWVIRFETPDRKHYRPIHLNGKAWRIGDPPGLLPLYRLPGLAGAEVVYVTEGEKAADALTSLGLAVTTSAHGAGSAKKTDWSALANRIVVIVPDNDVAGEQYATELISILDRLEPPPTVKILRLPGLPHKGDAVEYILARRDEGLSDDAIRAELSKLAAKAPRAEAPGPKLHLVRLTDVGPEPLEWLWPARVPLGKVTLIAGDPGLGKSIVTLDIAARVSRGVPWPDTAGQTNSGGSVVILSAEDDPGDTIRPRLDAASADVDRIHLLTAVQRSDGTTATFSLARDLPALKRALTSISDCRLVVIDPISAYLGGTDSHKNADIRGLLAPLAELAGRHRVAVLAVTHLNKSLGGKAVYRATGSLAFIAAARAALLVIGDRDAPGRRLLLPMKSNLGPMRHGLAYRITSKSVTGIGSVGYVDWEADPVEVTADDALRSELPPGDQPKITRGAAVGWLGELLSAGSVQTNEVRNQAEAAGFSWGTVRRAKDELGIIPRKLSFNGPWLWQLPDEDAHEDAQDAQHRRLRIFVETAHLGDGNVSSCDEHEIRPGE